MATWIKTGKDIQTLLSEAAQIDPYIAEALGDVGPVTTAHDFTHVVADLCWSDFYDEMGGSIFQSITIERDGAEWHRKGRQVVYEGRRAYGAREPGFTLSWKQEIERRPEGPREWTPQSPDLIYQLMLTVAKTKSSRAVKRAAQDLGWELISG